MLPRTVDLSNIAIHGYKFISKHSPTNAGGVGLYIKKILNFLEDKILNLPLKGLKPVSLKFLDIKTKILSLDVSTDTHQ